MSLFLILLIVLLCTIIISVVTIAVLIAVIRGKNGVIKRKSQDISYLSDQCDSLRRQIEAGNTIQKKQEEGKRNEDKILNTPDGSYTPTGMFDRFKKPK